MTPNRAIARAAAKVQRITKRWTATLSNSTGDITPGASAAVPGQPGMVYLVMPDGAVLKAYNGRVPAATGLRVWAGYEPHNPTFFRVLDFNVSYVTPPTGGSTIGSHHWIHEFLNPFGGWDVIYSQARQLMPLRVSVVAGFVVKVESSPVWTPDGWALSDPATLDLESYVPVSGFRYVLVFLAASGVLTARAGAAVPGLLPGLSYDDIPAAAAGETPLAAVRLYAGQAGILETQATQDIVDLRFARVGGWGVNADVIWDALGDIAVGTGADTADRLPVGTDGQYLGADSGAPLGVAWVNPPTTGEFPTVQIDDGALTVGTAATAFGDSITVGQGASDADHSYIGLLAAAKNWVITSAAVSGSMAADQADAIHAAAVAVDSISTYMIGTNDEKLYNTPALLADFQSILLAELAWLAIPDSAKILGTDTGRVTYGGTWTDIPVWGLGKYASVAGDSATFEFYGSNLIISCLAYASDRTDTNLGTFTVTIDGVLRGTYSSAFQGVIDTIVGARDYAPFAIVVPDLAEAQHTVVLELTNSEHVYFNWAAPTRGAQADSGPYVYVSNVIRQSAAGYIAHDGSEADVTKFNTVIRAAASLLASLGLNVALVDSVNRLDPTAHLDADGIHPNDAGHAAIAEAFRLAMNAVEYAGDRQMATHPAFTRADLREGAAPSGWPAAGVQSLFIDSDDHRLKRIDNAGTVTDIESGVARQYRQLLYVSDGMGSFNFLIDGDGLPLSGTFDLE
jgi:lysophospholipase L1-like esterase